MPLNRVRSITLALLLAASLPLYAEEKKEEKPIPADLSSKLEIQELKMTNLWLTYQKQQADYNAKMKALNEDYGKLMLETYTKLGIADPTQWQYVPEDKKFVQKISKGEKK